MQPSVWVQTSHFLFAGFNEIALSEGVTRKLVETDSKIRLPVKSRRETEIEYWQSSVAFNQVPTCHHQIDDQRI